MERPIIFSTEMVKAILDGRKTQTRRVLKPQPPSNAIEVFSWFEPTIQTNKAPEGCWYRNPDGLKFLCKSPYGQAGDRLWVREAWRDIAEFVDVPQALVYLADGPDLTMISEEGIIDLHSKWKPSIHMPRWASRITLEITEVRVERLQEISEEDARTEGFICRGEPNGCPTCFANTWDSINAKRGYGWETNPWAWVISFRKEATDG